MRISKQHTQFRATCVTRYNVQFFTLCDVGSKKQIFPCNLRNSLQYSFFYVEGRGQVGGGVGSGQLRFAAAGTESCIYSTK